MTRNKDDQDEVKVLDHEYDGIQELDNPLPRWWLATFYLAILFTPLYIGWFHFGPGLSLRDELARDLSDLKARQVASQASGPSGPTEEELLAILNDPARREAGRAKFDSTCASCHGGKGEGGIGPNLADNYWLHGNGGMAAIVHIVSDGVPEKGMPPWKTLLKGDEILAVSAYVKSLRGTNPPGAKAPQGAEIKE